MPSFRRSGSVACFFVEGSLPDPLGPAFLGALEKHRFRSIENAASEETSIGWVTPEDPTGGSFAREDMDRDSAVWLRVRIDKKRAPSKWLQIYRQAEERAAGRKLSASERKDLREDLLARFLPRVLPAITFVDALFLPHDKMILLFGTAATVKEACTNLFYKTFGVPLAAADPHRLALSVGLDRRLRESLESAAPIRWPDATD